MPILSSRSREMLRNFFGGYLHQDMDLEFSTWEEAVASFSADVGPVVSAEVVEAIGELRRAGSDEEIACLVHGPLACDFRPGREASDTIIWLEKVQRALTFQSS